MKGKQSGICISRNSMVTMPVVKTLWDNRVMMISVAERAKVKRVMAMLEVLLKVVDKIWLSV